MCGFGTSRSRAALLCRLADGLRTQAKTNATRQLMAVVIRPPISGPMAAPIPPMPLIRPNAQARDFMSVKSMVVRMHTGGISRAVLTPSKIELPSAMSRY